MILPKKLQRDSFIPMNRLVSKCIGVIKFVTINIKMMSCCFIYLVFIMVVVFIKMVWVIVDMFTISISVLLIVTFLCFLLHFGTMATRHVSAPIRPVDSVAVTMI